jgi:hypothetical protein
VAACGFIMKKFAQAAFYVNKLFHSMFMKTYTNCSSLPEDAGVLELNPFNLKGFHRPQVLVGQGF